MVQFTFVIWLARPWARKWNTLRGHGENKRHLATRVPAPTDQFVDVTSLGQMERLRDFRGELQTRAQGNGGDQAKGEAEGKNGKGDNLTNPEADGVKFRPALQTGLVKTQYKCVIQR
jgi:hypothetical protein